MRKIGVGVLGLIGGVLLAIIIQDILATALVNSGRSPRELGVVTGLLMPILAVLGAVVTVMLHSRSGKHGRDQAADD